MFNELKAKKLANTAWEIINPGYIDSPEIKYSINLGGKDYLNIMIELGYKLKINTGIPLPITSSKFSLLSFSAIALKF